MASFETLTHEIGTDILTRAAKSKVVNANTVVQKMMDIMMSSEQFRVASLRFTDVAPTLKNDTLFVEHMQAYFGELSGALGFFGKSIPSSKWTNGILTATTKKSIRSLAHTFIAGETLEEGLEKIKELHEQGIAASIDILGEAVLTQSESDAFTQTYENAVDILSEHLNSLPSTYPEKDDKGIISRANVSIKLSALYPYIKPAAHEDSKKALCAVLKKLLDKAMQKNVFINVDMEQYSYLPLTLDVFETVLMEEKYKNYPHIGIVCQAYLTSSEKVLDRLISLGKKRGTPFSIRLVKGAYWDFESAYAEQMHWPAPVFQDKESTDANYEKLTEKLIYAFPHVRPCIASHNVRSLAHAIALTDKRGLDRSNVEFQVLYGMADPYRNALKGMGFRVRQYCPLGEFIPGMSYLVRRLLENTANQSFLRQQSYDKAQISTLLKKPEFKYEKQEKEPTGSIFDTYHNNAELDFTIPENRTRLQKALEVYKEKLPYHVGKNAKRASFTHPCPWDTSLITTKVFAHTKKDAEQAVETASKAFENWRDLGAEKRAKILHKAADLMQENFEELFALQVYEAGKDWAHTDADICEAIDFLRFYAESCKQLEKGMQPLSVWGESNQVVYEPKGVCAVIAPWNFPLAISTGMTAAALATGNSVVYKPAEQTSATGLKMVEILHEAGVPKETLQLIVGAGETVGQTLVEHPKTNIIAFTGSRGVGLHILKEAADIKKGQQHTKKCVIEMGGKNALIIDISADLDEAVPAAIHSAFGFQGQKCSACSRIIVVGEETYARFKERMQEMVEGMTYGIPTDPFYDANTVIDEDSYNKVMHYMKLGEKQGNILARASNNRKKGDHPDGYFIAPTVFENVPLDSPVTTDEIFGPITCVYKAKDLNEALEMAQNSEFALTGGLFSRNPKSIEKARKTYRVGNLYINRGITGALVGRQPFGGGGMSGTGTKAGGLDYLYNFVEPRTITENTMRRGYAVKEE